MNLIPQQPGTNGGPVLKLELADIVLAPGGSLDTGLAYAFADPDGDVLSFSITMADGSALPGWVSIDSSTGVLHAAPGKEANHNLDLVVTANDGHGGTVSDTISLKVKASDVTDGEPDWSGLNRVTGSAAADKLNGTAAADLVDAGRGNDRMRGADGSDVFLFEAGDGKDRVLDFHASGTAADQIDLTDWVLVADFNDFLANHVRQVDDRTIITNDDGDRIVLLNIDKAELDAGNVLI